jgi:hypothetical protein
VPARVLDALGLQPRQITALGPVSRAFRVDMAAWQMDHGRRTGLYDLAMIERQLSKTGTAPP